MNIMREVIRIAVVVVAAGMLHGCAAMMSAAYGGNDLYQNDNREVLIAEAEAARAEAEARRAMYEAQAAEANAAAAAALATAGSTTPNYNSVLVTDYQSAYARRLHGFESPTYRMPSSYYSLSAGEAIRYASAYDPAFYNIMVSGDEVWVEPKYITSMFGSWGATNLTRELYKAQWYYGWSYHIDPFYYVWWGYPHYSWYDWNWTICYGGYHFSWYWGPGYYPYYPGYHPGYHPPHHAPRPPHHAPHHNGRDKRDNHGYNTAPRYTSPTSNRNFGGGSQTQQGGRPAYSGSTSSGAYKPSGVNNLNNRNGSNVQRVTRNDKTTNRGQATQTQTKTQTQTQRSNNYRQSNTSNTTRREINATNASSRTTISGSNSAGSGGSIRSGSSGGGRVGGTTSTRR